MTFSHPSYFYKSGEINGCELSPCSHGMILLCWSELKFIPTTLQTVLISTTISRHGCTTLEFICTSTNKTFDRTVQTGQIVLSLKNWYQILLILLQCIGGSFLFSWEKAVLSLWPSSSVTLCVALMWWTLQGHLCNMIQVTNICFTNLGP